LAIRSASGFAGEVEVMDAEGIAKVEVMDAEGIAKEIRCTSDVSGGAGL
jgi:hypothetical protein